MTKEIAKKEERALARPSTKAGLEDMEQSDLVVPRIRLIQPISNDAEHGAGNFINTVTGAVYKSPLYVVPLKARKGRFMFDPENHSASRDLICKSDDAKNGSKFGLCSACEHREWGDKDAEGNCAPPNCHLAYNFMCLVTDEDGKSPDTSNVGIVSFSKSGEYGAKQWISIMALRDCDIYEAAYKIESKLGNQEKGRYFVPKVTPFRNSTPEEIEIAVGIIPALTPMRTEANGDG